MIALEQKKLNSELVYAGHDSKIYTSDEYAISTLNENTERLARKNAQAFKDRFDRLLTQVESLGAKPICVSQPLRYVMNKDGINYGVADVLGEGFSGLDYDYALREINTVMAELCGDSFLDLYSYEFSDEHFYDGVHTTALGSIHIGNTMADFVIQELLN